MKTKTTTKQQNWKIRNRERERLSHTHCTIPTLEILNYFQFNADFRRFSKKINHKNEADDSYKSDSDENKGCISCISSHAYVHVHC